jgi:hypothetical protein
MLSIWLGSDVPQSEGQGAVASVEYAFILRELLLGGCVQATKDPLD